MPKKITKTTTIKQTKKTRKQSSSQKKNRDKKEPSEHKHNKNVNITFFQNSDTYTNFANGISTLLEEARHLAAKSVNAILTATYWEMGRRIVEIEQNGKIRAEYGSEIIDRLSIDLTAKFGRGFKRSNLSQMRTFYCAYPRIVQTLSGQFRKKNNKSHVQSGQTIKIVSQQLEDVKSKQKSATLMRKLLSKSLEEYLVALSQSFLLSWSHYIRLLSVKTAEARKFYETEAIRGGWSVRQLGRQISTLFYERTALSKDKATMLTKGTKAKPADIPTPEEEIKDPIMLEFLGLKDEYSESQLEEALIHHLETFLLELGNDFTFVGRQKRIRIGDTWYRIDLLLYHRRLRCLVIIDLKVGKFNHADVGQMNLYLNYALEQLTLPDEKPPVGLILCSEHDKVVAHYAMGNMLNKVMAAEYHLSLPDTQKLAEEIEKTRILLQKRTKLISQTKQKTASKKNKRLPKKNKKLQKRKGQ